MASGSKTSVAGSLSTTFSEKLKVASAKVGGDFKEINVAIIKATTNQFHVVPKEKHVRTLKLAVHPSKQRRDVVHIISELHRRLQDSTDWLTVLKTLVTLHRLMRETEPSFMDELVRYNEGLSHAHQHPPGAGGPGAHAVLPVPARLFCTDNFIDRTTSEGRYDFSEWVRAYGKYLDEQLTVYTKLKWYVEQEAPGTASRMRSLGSSDLLTQLPHLQRLQRRLLDCVPRGAATHDPVVLFCLSLVVKESFKLYKAVSEGIINLADAFFEMDYHDAVRGLEFYKESMAASDAQSGYYATIEQIEEIKRTMQLPKLSTPPSDFLSSMEAYVAEAPRQLASATEAPMPIKKGAPLRKGKLTQAASGAKRTSSGPSAAAVAAAVAAAPRDPGMVLPLPSTSASAPTAHTDESEKRGGSAVGSPTSAERAVAAPAAQQDLLGEVAASAEPAPAAAASQKPAPSPMDLLSGLDFSFSAPGGEPSWGAPAAAPAFASATSNPFADMPVAAPAVQPLMQHTQQPAVGSSNPFGEPSPAGADSSFGGAAGLEWSVAPIDATQPQMQQRMWAAHPAVYQQQQQQPYAGSHGMPLPPAGNGPHLAVSSDDPFANFGAPSPAGAASRPSGGAFSASTPVPYGAAMSPPRPIGDEMSKAALHDPFAALTGLPPKSSPGAAGGSY